jgi:hypothetical protein
MCRYFWEALIYREDVDVWCAGPWTGKNIPWGGGMVLPESYSRKPDHPTSITNPPMVSYPMLETKKPWEPDLWLEVNAGLVAMGKPVSAPLALVLSDPHVLGDFYDGQKARADYVFGMQTPYLKRGDIWLPYAYSQQWHTPTETPFSERRFDAALIGLQYGHRNDLIGRLIQEGREVFYKLGLAYDDARAIYHDTRVGLNWSSLQDTTARCFELMAFGLPAVMNKVPDLVELFQDGQDFLGFETLEEAVEKVAWLLDHPNEAEKIGRKAREAVEEHTWGARIDQIFEEVGLAGK